MVPPSTGSGPRRASLLVTATFTLSVAALLGCASPGAPRPPSLQLPEKVQDLQARRSGLEVELLFTVPSRTSDGLALRASLHARFCRQLAPRDTCSAVSSAEIKEGAQASAGVLQPGRPAVWRDHLPEALTQGTPRAISYRVEIQNQDGRSAGMSDPVYVAAGAAPPPVEGFTSQGTRDGVLLQWTPVAEGGEVLLKREQLDGAPPPEPPRALTPGPRKHRRSGNEPPVTSKRDKGAASQAKAQGTEWLQAEPGSLSAARTLDHGAVEGVRYRYTAVRRLEFHAGARTLELRSAPSTPVEIVWRDIYPPSAPRGLTAIGFDVPSSTSGDHPGYAVDLVWEPVDDARLAGYLVRRVALTPSGELLGAAEQLTPEPLLSPAFHDATANSAGSYRYEVTAVDAKGNASSPASVEVKARQQ